MSTHQPCQIDRRALMVRGAAAAAWASLLAGPVFASTPSPEAGTNAIASLVAGNTAFAFDLYREFRQAVEGNIVFSPYSVSLALAMAYAGAKGETATQLAQVLGLPGADTPAAFQALTSDLLARGNAGDDRGDAELRIANALWGEKTFPFSADFMATLETSYAAGVNLADFKHAPEDAREEINGWVADKTDGHIEEIVPEGVISTQTRLVLANAVFFASTWRSTFETNDTADDIFHLADGSTVDAPFMTQTGHFLYAEAERAQVIELPYIADGYAMTIILPDEGELDAVEEDLSPDLLGALVDPMASTRVELYMPRFEFDVAEGLTAMLKAMGMPDAFDPDRSDLTGMVDGSTDERLAISDVLHEAFISVDEDGTEAAAATAVIVGATSAAPDPEGPVVLRIDRPFLFAIRDTRTGTVLFLGRVMDPAPAGA